MVAFAPLKGRLGIAIVGYHQGMKDKRKSPAALSRQCRKAMANANHYAEWREAASELDTLERNDAWKNEPRSRSYDWRLIHSRYWKVRRMFEAGDVAGLVYELRQGLHWNLGNLGSPYLYGRAHFGTKRLIDDYIDTVARALDFICDSDEGVLPHAERLRFFKQTAQSYGRSALMLSGGATLGLFHVGVVKALYREGLMPDVISGSSAGSVVAATVGTRAPTEMEELLTPEAAYYHFWRRLGLRQVIAHGVLMDQTQLREAVERNVRDLSFEEAHRLSGMSINITVSAAGRNQKPRLLNHLTFPHLLMREAVMASCAVPWLFEPVMLCTRDENGERTPYSPLQRWSDGSLQSDLPALRVRRLFNVNHHIVSQTNPHVLPFMNRRPPHRDGSASPVAALRNFAGASLRLEAQQLLRLGGGSLPTRALRTLLDKSAVIIGQKYHGNITVLPDLSIWRYANVTSNPNMKSVRRFILEGERATWPHIEAVRTQTRLARTMSRCIERLEGRHGTLAAGTPELRVVRRARDRNDDRRADGHTGSGA